MYSVWENNSFRQPRLMVALPSWDLGAVKRACDILHVPPQFRSDAQLRPTVAALPPTAPSHPPPHEDREVGWDW
jgi:hypothetical protein